MAVLVEKDELDDGAGGLVVEEGVEELEEGIGGMLVEEGVGGVVLELVEGAGGVVVLLVVDGTLGVVEGVAVEEALGVAEGVDSSGSVESLLESSGGSTEAVVEGELGLLDAGFTVKVHPLKTMLAKDKPKRKLRRFFMEGPPFLMSITSKKR